MSFGPHSPDGDREAGYPAYYGEDGEKEAALHSGFAERPFPKELPFWQRLSNGRMRSMKTVRRQHCTVRKRDCAARRRRRILPGQRRHCREQWQEFRCCDKLRSTSFFFYAYAIKKHEAFGYGIKAFFYDTSGLSGKNG